MVREWVIVNGQQIGVEGIDRGNLLLWSREEWFARYKREFPRTVVMIAILVIIFLVPSIFFLSIVAVILLVIFIGMYAGIGLKMLRDIERGDAVPGIYEGGIEFPTFPMYFQRLFIPWEEMKEVSLRQGPLATGTLNISIHNHRYPQDRKQHCHHDR